LKTNDYEIRELATAILLEGFDTYEDLHLSNGFRLNFIGSRNIKYGLFFIAGPTDHQHDDHVSRCIEINTYHREFVRVRFLHPDRLQPGGLQPEADKFLYSDPEFPKNAYRQISHYLTTWMCYWDCYREVEFDTEDRDWYFRSGRRDLFTDRKLYRQL